MVGVLEMTFNDKLEQLDKELRELRRELESDLLKYRDSGYLTKRKWK